MVRQYLALLALALLLAGCWGYGDDDAQYIKGVKGGHGGRGWSQGASLYRNSQNSSEFGYGTSYDLKHNLTAQVEEIGVCYIEVPTASLARDRSHVPAGNGSRSDLSRIRTCCKGYERNIHNYRKCDPICTTECVNALCTAPETCTCFPDHVKNLAGFCVATCPIGCQNGNCDGGKCLCKEGYTLDIDGKYCVPRCKDNCGGVGNCTAPNVCECKKQGFHSTSDGSCRAACDRCVNGDCVAPNQCRCRQGYDMDQNGDCMPQCYQSCGPNGRCVSPNVCEYSSTTKRPDVPNSYPHGYYVTQYPGRQPQYPASQHTYNHSNPRQPSHPQGYPSGSAQYPVNSENSQYPYNPQQNLYPQYNSSGTTYYPVNPQQPSQGQYPTQYPPNPQYPPFAPQNSSAPLYPQLPPHTQYSSGSLQYPSYQQFNYSGSIQQSQSQQQSANSEYAQYGSNTQQIHSSSVPSPHHPQSSSHTQYIPIGPQNPSNPSYPSPYHQSYNPSNSPNPQVYPIDQTLEFDTPQCAHPCINATCIEGNRCACNPGYVPDRSDYTESRCEPYCPGGCQNGVCIAPYSCACIEGYHKETHGVKGARARCVRRERRSLNSDKKQRSKREISVADRLVYMIPDYD